MKLTTRTPRSTVSAAEPMLDATAYRKVRTAPILHGAGSTDVALRLYGERSGHSAPLLVYFHGGLFDRACTDEADALVQRLATNAVVACVDYPLAHELKFPNTVEVAFGALNWAAQHACRLGADAGRIYVAGEQAGGNLAAAVAMIARDRGMPEGARALAGQILITPMLDPEQATLSMREAAECPYRSAWSNYLCSVFDATHPYAGPLHSRRLGGLAPALIVIAGRDPLRDEADLYAAKLEVAKVPVSLLRLKDMSGGVAEAHHPGFETVATAIEQFISGRG